MMIVLGILGFTVFLFVSEIVRVDVAALAVMVLLGFISHFFVPLVEMRHLFDGFSSNAVMSIIAVMIIGAGLDKTGLMNTVASQILRLGGTTEKRIIPLISGTVGTISSFMQNVGAAALFLPVVGRIASRTGLPMSRLLMPMGFCAILGGTVTMIGSSPLILLNDLILTSNRSLPQGIDKMATFDLFEVTPVGLALVATGILYFVFAGRYVLPSTAKKAEARGGTTMQYLRDTYGLAGDLFEVEVPAESPLVGKTVEQVEFATDHKLLIVAMRGNRKQLVSPARDVEIVPNTVMALIGDGSEIGEFAVRHRVTVRPDLSTFADLLAPTRAGVSEVVIPPSSKIIGKSMADIRMRKTYGISVLAMHRGGETLRTKLSEIKFQAGDTLIMHSQWEDLARLQKDRNFVVVTSDFPHEELRRHKVNWALLFFAVALGLVLFTDIRLSVALLVGAVGMVLSGVLTIDEAYEAVSWKTVFLLASLIPLGLAVEGTGTARWIAQQTLELLEGVPVWVLQAAIGALATFFTLVMSNVGATVLLVPLAVNIALGAGADPRVFALTVAICTSNSFLIPTHQVNALIMGPAGYKVIDFVRAGGVMTVLFLVVALVMLNLVF
ncbi:MAG TPA: SLC13 family permease [Gammaproteobacteria bacterium]